MAVRTRAGLFDVSHMGEIEIAGKGALEAVQRISSNDANALKIGQAQYAGLLTPDGTFIDDMLVYRMASSHFMLVVNAANAAKDFAWISEQVKLAGDAAVVDSSSRYALIAIQGPAARDVLQQLTAVDLGDIRYYWFSYGEVATARVTISRTGYTGEDGYEIFVPPNMADRVWQALIQAGRGDVIPCGLGARDTLRLEAAMRLYGNDIDESTTALEAGLGWTIGWKKGDFIGRERLLEQKERGITRTLVGFEMLERGIARQGYHRHEWRRRNRQGHEWHADALPQEGRRHGVRSPCRSRSRERRSTSTSAAAPRRRTWSLCRSTSDRQGERMAYPTDLKYTKDHEWIRISGDIAEIGITDFAQDQLGDVVFVELPEPGRTIKAGESFGSIESVKAVSELFAPMSGEVVEVNPSLKDHPEVVNSQPHETWMVKVRVSDPKEAGSLLDSAQYDGITQHVMSSLDASDWFARRHIGPSPDERAEMLEAVGAPSLDALMDEAIPASIRLKKPLSLPPAESEHQYLHRLGHLAHRNKRLQVLHRSRLPRHLHAERDPSDGDGEPGLVHAVHALSGGDRTRPARIAPQLPDDGDGSDGDGSGERIAAGRGDGRRRSDGADAPRAHEPDEGRRTERLPRQRRLLPADDRRPSVESRAAGDRSPHRADRRDGIRRVACSARSCSIQTRSVSCAT